MASIDVLLLVEPQTLLLDLAGVAEALRLANQALRGAGRDEAFRLRFVGARAEAESSVGLQLAALEPLPDAVAADSWLVLSGRRHGPTNEASADSSALLAHMRTEAWLHRHGNALLASPRGRVLTICAGALLAARAGLLDGRSCTTHHELLDELHRLAPRAQVLANRVFVLDGALASSAGITAGIDLALQLVAKHCGEAIAASVAQTMVVYLRRGAQDPELSPLLAHRHHMHAALHRVQDAVCARPTQAWTLESMAAVAHVSPRHLSRLFGAHTSTTPLRYLQSIRLETAQRALQTGASALRAAEQAGFSSDQQLRRARRRLLDGGAAPG